MVNKKFFPHIFNQAESLISVGSGYKSALDSEFSMLVWNIYKGRKRGWAEDFQQLSKDKQLVLLQEAVMKTRFDPLFNIAEKMEWMMARSHMINSNLAETGVKTGSVTPSLSQSYYVSPDAEPLFKTPKTLLSTIYPIEGSEKPLQVINVHAINFVSVRKYSRQIAQIVEAVASHDGPLIIAGDFNTWNAARSSGLLELTEKMDLTQLPLDRKGRLNHFNLHLDHVFYRGLEPVKSGVIRVRSSDHDAITVTFRLSS